NVQAVRECLRGTDANHEVAGWLPLQFAATRGQKDVLRTLLGAGAKVDRPGTEETALHAAVKAGHGDCVWILLGAHADIEAATEKRYTALHMAALNGRIAISDILLRNGAKVGVQTVNGETPLTLAARGGHAEIAELLLKAGANVEGSGGE